MTEPPSGDEEPTAIGIDLGSATTVGAVRDGDALRLLEGDGGPSIPTRLAAGEDGFAVGEAATGAGDGTVVPIPYVDPTARSMSGANDVPLQLFFRLLYERWTGRRAVDGGQGSEADQETVGDETDGDTPAVGTAEETAFSPTTVSVPGGYAADDLADVEAAAEAAGFRDVQAIRSPVAAAALATVDADAERTLGVVDIGSRRESYAVVTARETGELRVDARTVHADGGRRRIDDAVARWVVGAVEAEHDVSVRLDDAAMTRVRDAVHEALDDLDPDGETAPTVDLELDDGVELTDGGLFASDGLGIDVDLDLATAYERALADELERIRTRIGDLLATVDPDDVDELVLVGGGSRPGPVRLAVERAFDVRPAELPAGDELTANALGAAVVSARRGAGDPTVGRETLPEAVAVRALGPSGVEERVVTAAGDGPGDTVSTTLARVSPERLSGRFEVASRHRLTGETVRKMAYTLDVPADYRGDVEVSVSPAPSGEPADVTAELPAADDRSPDLASGADRATAWLAHADADRSELPEPDGAAVTPYEHRSDARRALGGLDEERIARAVWELRRKLWTRTAEHDDDIPVDDLELFLRELDRNLEREGIEIIAPEVGSKLDADRHGVAAVAEADAEPETVLDVLSPGVAVDGQVIEPAKVEVAE